jgi:HEAT repeat protein
MGLFGLFGSKEEREKGALKKLEKRVTERYGPPENRQKAIEQLGNMGTPGALATLCMRFTVNAEPGITDQEEKETTRRILVDSGERSLEPIAAFVREQEDGIAWGLRALAQIAPEEKVLEVVVGEIARLGKVYTRDPEKKLVLLTWLREHHAGVKNVDVEAALLPLLEDFSDDVRITATRAFVAIASGEKARDALIQLLLRDQDNARVRGEVLEALAAMGADVKGHRPSVEPLLVEPFFLDREGRVKKRG